MDITSIIILGSLAIVAIVCFALGIRLYFNARTIRRVNARRLRKARERYEKAAQAWMDLLTEERERMGKAITTVTKERDDVQKRLELLLLAQAKIDSYNDRKEKNNEIDG